MKKGMILLALVLILCLAGCSILPEGSPILMDGEETETKGPAKNKDTTEESSGSEEEPTDEATPEPTPAPTPREPQKAKFFGEAEGSWVELPEGGEAEPIRERVVKDKEIEPDDEDPELATEEPVDQRVLEDGEGTPKVMQSYLTGEWKDVDVVNRRSLAVMFPNAYRAGGNNNSPILQLYGISRAGIIYEAPVEGRITALMGIFEEYDQLERLGPIANARDYFIYDAMSFDSIYVSWGMARAFTEALINSDRIDDVSAPTAGIAKGYDDAFFRDEDIIPDASKDYNGYFDLTILKEALEDYGYATEYRDTFEQGFLFANDKLATYKDYPSVTKIWPGGKGKNAGGYGNYADKNPHFEYDEERHLYYRYQYGEPLSDSMNNKKIAVTNVVFKICHGEERTPDQPKLDYLAYRVHGQDECIVFTNGKMIRGTWVKSSDQSADYLYDENGNEIVLNQGKTWVCLIWQEFSQYMTFE